ncbi:MAG: EscU/YscU/HrcU family type III secretion system export apparatus switch protein [Magnetospiraceae bacterium]
MADQNDDKGDKRQTAVALGYDGGAAPPKVLAAGHGAIAEEILRLAFEHGVKVREDADLAEMLSALDVGDEIPVEAFAAVAEILSYIYQMSGDLPPDPAREPV